MTYFETIAVGEETPLGSHLFTAEEIRRFAARYDPQPFHLDETAARQSLFGGLCASGWHTAAVFMSLNIRHREEALARWEAAGHRRPDFGPSPGVKNLRWLRPVFAGDTISYAAEVTAKRTSETRRGWGVVESRIGAKNEAGDPVFSMEAALFIETG